MTTTLNPSNLRDLRTSTPASLSAFPADLRAWTPQAELLDTLRASAARACGNSWLNLLSDTAATGPVDDLLVLVAYCYVQGVYHSIDVARQLDEDPLLADLRSRLVVSPERIRRFRRERRRALTDCLTHAFATLWRRRHPGTTPATVAPVAAAATGSPERSGSVGPRRVDLSFLEPFYLQAQDRIDRAVVLDSMALDF